MALNVTSQLAEFARETTYFSLPHEVREFVKLCILDQLGVEAFSSAHPIPRLVRDHVLAASAGGCTIVGSSKTASAEGAALANGVAGYGFELDDVHLPSLNHPGAAVVPAALAVGELVGATGHELVAAVAAGYEVMCRVGRGLSPSYAYDKGFHPQGVVGPIGAAVTASILLGLNADGIDHAMSLSVSHAGGTLQYTQTSGDSARLHAGLGAMGGVRSALLAKAGLRGPGKIIEGRYGLARVYSDNCDLSLMIDDLGSVYSLIYNTFKVRPFHAFVHAAVDVTLEALSTEARQPVGNIEHVALGAASHMQRFASGSDRHRLEDSASFSISAVQSSLELAVAHAIVRGGELDSLLELGGDTVVDTVTLDLARQVTITQDQECEEEYNGGGHRGPKVKVKADIGLRDGRTLRATNFAKGSYENQLSATELHEKFDALMSRSTILGTSGPVAEMVLNCESVDSVSELTRLLQPAEVE